MSQSRRDNFGYPRSEEKRLHSHVILSDCGGMGGISCGYVAGETQFVGHIKVPKFVVYNRSLDFEVVRAFIGTKGSLCMPPDGYFIDEPVPWWLGFSVDGVLTDEEVKSQGMMIDPSLTPIPQIIFVQGAKLPQPSNPAWHNRIYYHFVWDSPEYVLYLVNLAFKIGKHDYDIVI